MTKQRIQQIPILCGNCGGPLSGLDDIRHFCDYCGREDSLPASQVDRNALLSHRILMAKQSALRFDGMVKSYATVYEDPNSISRQRYMFLGLAVLIYGLGLLTQWSSVEKDPIHFFTLMIPSFIWMVLGFAFSLRYSLAQKQYARDIRPHLSARPRVTGGIKQLSCRVCGGPLPTADSFIVKCHFCLSTNIVDEEIQNKMLSKAEAARVHHELKAVDSIRMIANFTNKVTAHMMAIYILVIAITIPTLHLCAWLLGFEL